MSAAGPFARVKATHWRGREEERRRRRERRNGGRPTVKYISRCVTWRHGHKSRGPPSLPPLPRDVGVSLRLLCTRCHRCAPFSGASAGNDRRLIARACSQGCRARSASSNASQLRPMRPYTDAKRDNVRSSFSNRAGPAGIPNG
jgi:hypothetical protein